MKKTYTKGLLVGIYQSKMIGGCSNYGLSSKYSKAILTGESVPEIFSASEDAPLIMLRKKIVFGEEYIYCTPLDPVDLDNVGYMMGGCFVYTSDSRLPSKYPIPLHDRQETQKQYDILSM